jgi:hypothetical protein
VIIGLGLSLDQSRQINHLAAGRGFGEGQVLPGAGGRRQHFTNPHARQPLPERVTIDAVAIAEEVGRRGVVWEGVDDLLGGPGARGMFGHVEVEDAPAVVGEHDEDEENAEPSGGNGEEIDRDQVPDMIG